MSAEPSAYGVWPLVIINAAMFILFAFSFARPRTGRDWRSFGAFSGFLVALFTEMYGFPLTIYLLSGWLGNLRPGLDLLAHDNGHLWETLFFPGSNPHTSPVHLVSEVLISGGFLIVAFAWPVLHRSQREHGLASTGLYALVRHPQYVGFTTIMLGFLVQWPTLVTLAMFPVLVGMYVRLARREERDALAEFGDTYARYMMKTPAFWPHWAALRGFGRKADERRVSG